MNVVSEQAATAVASRTTAALRTQKSTGLRRRTLAETTRPNPTRRRWLFPERGVFKLIERAVDRLACRYIFPRLFGVAGPYGQQLDRHFTLTESTLTPTHWPAGTPGLRILLISDIHVGAFLDPGHVRDLFETLMDEGPDLVAIAGDIVTGLPEDLDPFHDALAPLARAPLGAWFCLGNHDHFSGEPDRITATLDQIGIRTLRNATVPVEHDGERLLIGGIDDRILGRPDWDELIAAHGAPHVLLAHNPDDFFEAAAHRVPVTLAGHTHGGQVRLPGGPPLVRQSRYFLDEGLFAYEDSLLVVSRGFGASGLPWRSGAWPEAVMVSITPPRS